MFSVKRARKSRKLSVQQLADIIGVTRNTVYRWEHGATMTTDSVIKVSKALNIPLETILNKGGANNEYIK